MNQNNNKGFTLIELLVVIAIIGLLSSVVMVSLDKARARARDVRRISEIEQLIRTIKMYKAKKGVYPGDEDDAGVEISPNCNSDLKEDLKKTDYIKTIPEDPIEDSDCFAVGEGNDEAFFYGWDSGHCCEGSECISINKLETKWAVHRLAQKYPDHDDNIDNGVQYATGGGDANIGTGDDFNYCFIEN